MASKDTEEDMQDLIKTIKELETYKKEKYEKIPIKPLLTGRDIMEIFGLPEGPQIGKIKKSLEDAQMEGIVKTKEDAVQFIKKFISQTQN